MTKLIQKWRPVNVTVAAIKGLNNEYLDFFISFNAIILIDEDSLRTEIFAFEKVSRPGVEPKTYNLNCQYSAS